MPLRVQAVRPSRPTQASVSHDTTGREQTVMDTSDAEEN